MESKSDICLKEICKQLKDLNHTMGEIYKIFKNDCDTFEIKTYGGDYAMKVLSKTEKEGDDLK